MDITIVPNKALYKIGQKFLKRVNFEVDDYYETEGNTESEFAIEIFNFLKTLGMLGSDSAGSAEFFYMFLRLNFVEFAKENFQDFATLKRPELKTYEFIWETRQTLFVNIDYQHKYNSYLNKDEAFLAVESLRYSGDIFPGDGEEINYETTDSELDQDTIENFREVKKNKKRG